MHLLSLMVHFLKIVSLSTFETLWISTIFNAYIHQLETAVDINQHSISCVKFKEIFRKRFKTGRDDACWLRYVIQSRKHEQPILHLLQHSEQKHGLQEWLGRNRRIDKKLVIWDLQHPLDLAWICDHGVGWTMFFYKSTVTSLFASYQMCCKFADRGSDMERITQI